MVVTLRARSRTTEDNVAIEAVLDGGGVPLTVGTQLDVVIDFDCVIQAWTLVANAAGNVVVDIWKTSLEDFPGISSGDSITGSEKPTLVNDEAATSTSLVGWTIAINQGDVLRFNVDSASGLSRVVLALKVHRS